MHELGIVMEVVKQVEGLVKEQDIQRVDKIVLQIGEISSVIPHFVEECFPAAVYNTSLEDTKLEIEMIPAVGYCDHCFEDFELTPNQGICPICKKKDFHIKNGREFIIKEIVVEEI